MRYQKYKQTKTPRTQEKYHKLAVTNFYDLIDNSVKAFMPLLKELASNVEDMTKYYHIDHYRKTVSFIIPITPNESHLVVFHLTERWWCSTWQKLTEHIDSALNSATKMFKSELKRVKNVTVMLVGNNYSTKIWGGKLRRYTRQKARNLNLGTGRVEAVLCNSIDWCIKFSSLLNLLYDKRLEKLYQSLKRKKVRAYGDVEGFTKKLKSIKEGIIAAFEKGLPRSSILTRMRSVYNKV